MKTPVNRQTVDLSAFPDLVVIYLGMRVRTIRGTKVSKPIGFQAFAGSDPARGSMSSGGMRHD